MHEVNLTYFGEREVARQSKVWTSTAGETSVFTTHRYDRQGRLYQVVEQSSGTGANITTTYGYDAACRLQSVSTPVSIAGTTVNPCLHRHPDGFRTVIHYWQNLQTGLREGFKYK